MLLTCPHCGFSRETDPARIPSGAKEVTCPSCKGIFSLPQPAYPAPPAPFPQERPDPAALPKAGFWIRVCAYLIDFVVVAVVQFASSILFSLAISATMELDEALLENLILLFSTTVGIAYFIFFTGYGGQTPGKMALRIKVIRIDGADIGYGRAFLRELPCKFLSWVLLGIGYLMVGFDRQKQGLHDKLAGTYVIRL